MMKHHPSPNFDDRRLPVDMLVLHYTGLPTLEDSLARLCDPGAKVSAHYLIDVDGGITRLVAEDQRAWHAGVSFWAGEHDINSASIGIELQNPGHEFGYKAFPEPQIESLIRLCRDIFSRHAIPPERVLGHADVAPARKQDPGELFPWQTLAAEGIGVWPETSAAPPPADEETLRGMFSRLGYDPEAPLADVVTAFQRHWQPDKVDGLADAITRGRLAALL